MREKLLTWIIADEIYGFLENEGILPEERKGCRRKSKGTEDELNTDKTLLQEVKWKKNLAMGWIDYRKPYDSPPLLGDRQLKYDWHSKKCSECFGKNERVLEGGVKL